MPACAAPGNLIDRDAYNLGLQPGGIINRLGTNDGRRNYWRARNETLWPIITGDCG